jgi:hypothetical protein
MQVAVVVLHQLERLELVEQVAAEMVKQVQEH